MKRVKAIYGYILAILGVPLVLFGLLGPSGGLDELLISATGLTLSPWIDGGQVVRTIDHGAYQTQVHRMVFDALVGERKKGFVQVDWLPPDALPARIDEEIDANGDRQPDFRVDMVTATKEVTLTPYTPWVLELEGIYRLEDSLIVRVTLRNPSFLGVHASRAGLLHQG
jgi:hypothetical protein